MARTATSRRTTTKKTDLRKEITEKYQEYVLLNGTPPASVFQFMHLNNWKETTFYEYFTGFQALERNIWKEYFELTRATLQADSTYASYSAREKMLAFYYTLIEVLRTNRSFVQYCYDRHSRRGVGFSYLSDFRTAYLDWVQEVIAAGKDADEIIDRPVLSERYKDGLWLQLLFVVRFWIKDDSKGFEKTDAAIEKAVNLSFELMGRGPLDQMIDFAKFLYHNRM